MKIFYSANADNIEGKNVQALLFVTKSNLLFSIEHHDGDTFFYWREGKNALYNLSKFEEFDSMKKVLSTYGNNSVSGTNSFYGLLHLIQALHTDFKWIWNSKNQNIKDEFYYFFRPVDDAKTKITYEHFRKEWNQIALNFAFLKSITYSNNKIVRMLDDSPDRIFKKGHFYLCKAMNEEWALLVGESNEKSIVSLNLIENGDKLLA
jgi:hypothetical protein